MSCAFSGVAYAASGGVPLAQESANPTESVADTNAVQPGKNSGEAVTPKVEYSDNTVSLKDYIDRELDSQRQLITHYQSNLTTFLTLGGYLLLILTLFAGFQIRQVVRNAERELKNISDEKEKAQAIVKEGQEQITNTVTEGQKHLDQLCNDAEVRFKKLIEQDMKAKFDELVLQAEKQIEATKDKLQLLDKLIESTKTSKELTPAEKKEVKKTAEDIEKIPEEKRTARDYFLLAFNTSNLDKRIELYSKSIDLKPDYAEAYNNRGFTYFLKGEKDLAFKDYEKAIELKLDFAAAYNNRGFAYSLKGEYDLAFKDLNKATELKPDFGIPYFNKARAFAMLGTADKVLEQLEIAAEKGFDNIKLARSDKGFDFLRENPRFKEILKKIEANAKKFQK